MSCTNRVIKVTETDAIVRLGVWDTDNVREQKFDFSAWAEAYGPGNLLIIAQRKTDEIPYEVAQVAISGNVATWIFDEADTAIPGYGSVALAYIVGDEHKARTVPYQTYTAPTIGMTGPVPPDPWESWFSRVLEASSDAKDAAAAAAASASDALSYATDAGNSAVDAAGSASDAADSARAAAGSASDAQNAADGAAGSAEEAGGFADAALQSKDDAEAAAQTATDKATEAGDYATSAEQSAIDAAASAEAAEAAAAAAIAITGASVGDVIRVASVDANGKPTAWTPQGVDASPAQNSPRLATSGGIWQALLALYPTQTKTGNPATFTAGADGLPIKALTFRVDAPQSGSGDPSPSNPRPFTFLNSATVERYGADPSDRKVTLTIDLGGFRAMAIVDLLTGVLTVMGKVYGLGNLTWSYESDTGRFYSNDLQEEVLRPGSNTVPLEGLRCSNYKAAASNDTGSVNNTIGVSTSGSLYLRDTRYTSASALRSWLTDNSVRIIEPIREPYTAQLTPQQLTSLLGENHITCSTGDVTATIRLDPTLALEEVAQA